MRGISDQCIRLGSRKCVRECVLVLILLSAQSALSVQLLRGPYLQLSTASNVTIRWRTDTLTDSRVQYGTNVNSLNMLAENPASLTNHEVRLKNLLSSTTYYN